MINQTEKIKKTSTNSVPVEMVQNLVQGFMKNQIEYSQKIEKTNKLIGDKLANMIALTNYECKKVELMLQKKYYVDSHGKKVYEEIQEDAMNTTFNSLNRLTDTTNLKLYEDLESAKTEIAKLQETVNEGKKREEELQKRNEKIHIKLTTTEKNVNEAIVALQSYVKLNKWHERLVQEVPVIRKKNSNIIWVQNWEGAVACYIRDNPKPNVHEFDIDDFR